jgi:hypothetical protein
MPLFFIGLVFKYYSKTIDQQYSVIKPLIILHGNFTKNFIGLV